MRQSDYLALRPDARFLVQLITGQADTKESAKNKTAPEQGAAAYSTAMDSDLSIRVDTVNRDA